ncbi:dead box RNA helicase [Niveomyces insectorum RCEF 264]|uniref:ATP-dependent RNA helicase n=1 Tax=Niveomyces insectorum RCEF 264 TaxID=1081102 RepID=A0A167QX92_9HYPO|nr:dead box RNA helicase [Niveomyces insectorum RCEF 264]
MFKTAVLRAARLSRATGLPRSTSSLSGLRRAVTLASGSSPAAPLGLIVPAVSRLSAADHSFHSSANHAASVSAAEQAVETPERAPGLVTQFADLASLGVHENLVRSLTQTLGYDTMTPVQSMTISPALAGKDMVAQAKTGTGKTLAFLIPTIQKMIADNPDLAYPRRVRARSDDILAIVLSPTRELAEQISEEARKLCRGTGVIVQTAVGGTQKREMLRRTKIQGCHLLVATPGRLLDVLSTPDSGIDAPKLSALVLDEADRMLDVGFDRELQEIVRYLPNRKQQPRQTLLFSATIPKDVISLARTYVDASNFEFVQTVKGDEVPTHEKVPQHIVPVRGYENIYPTMLELFKREIQAARSAGADGKPFKAIVFLPTTNYVQLTAMAFQRLSKTHRELPYMHHIHSKLTQAARTAAANAFRNADSGILFSSDVTARGMDFPNVSHVVQIGVPPDREQYIHRLGRTGRADKGGQGWLIVAQDEINLARNVLGDLPIKRAKGLENADLDLTNIKDQVPPETVADVKDAMQRVPSGLLVDTYMSFFGGSTIGRSMQTTLDNLNNWALHGWGWEEPPAINQELARKRGLLKLRGVRIAQPGGREHQSFGERRERQDSFGGGDPFERVFQQGSQDGGSRRQSSDRGRGFDRPRRQFGGDRFGGGDRSGGRSGGNRSRDGWSEKPRRRADF